VVDALEELRSLASMGADGAQSVVDAKFLDTVAGLLESPHARVRQETVEICQSLATHSFAQKLILPENFFNRLVSLLRRVLWAHNRTRC
jgi:hypothetical protein